MNGEPGAAVLSLFAQLIDRIKQRNPLRSDDKPLGGMVYSQLVLGMPIWKDDYFRPWTPAGGSSLRAAVSAGQGGVDGGSDAASREALRAMQSAWKTSLLCRTMLQVTKDGGYREYPTGRHLDFAYETVLNGMQPGTPVEIAPEVKERIAAAEKVLFKLDADGNRVGKTSLYENYVSNAEKLAEAKANFATEFATNQRDPAKLAIWPVVSAKFDRAVKQARNDLISEGAANVERALDVLASIGQPMQEHMVARSREAFDNWNLGLTGSVPGQMPYSLILPTNWCDPEDHQGFETLIVDRAEIQSFSAASSVSSSAESWMRHAESTGGGGGVLLGFAAFGGSHGSSSMNASFQDSSSSEFRSIFHNTAKNLHIELEYGLSTILRPWLVSDLFFLKNWFCSGLKKNAISDGTIDGQANSMEKTIPMIPQQLLVVRNVQISSTDWGSDGALLSQFYASSQGSIDQETSETSGAGGVSLGFISFGGRASHSEASATGQSSSFAASSSQSSFGSTFERGVLRMPGAQIVAFLSDIVPPCPDRDDPTLT
jgi:hypothetical protein